jgi:hypothetical protein
MSRMRIPTSVSSKSVAKLVLRYETSTAWRSPTLTVYTWSAWKSKLHTKVSVVSYALEILTGTINESHTDYDSEINDDLFDLLESSQMGHYSLFVKEIQAKYGRKGHKLYAALKGHFKAEDTTWCSRTLHKK